MEWRDEGVVLGLKRLGESSLIVEAMTRAHGRHLGLARGGRSLKMAQRAAARQHAGAWSGAPGSTSTSGLYQIEPLTLRAGRYSAERAGARRPRLSRRAAAPAARARSARRRSTRR